MFTRGAREFEPRISGFDVKNSNFKLQNPNRLANLTPSES